MPDKNLPPVVFPSNSVGVAFVWAEGQGFVFYYDQGDGRLYVADGKEEDGYSKKPITVGNAHERISFNAEPTPTPLAAGYDDSRKEIRVYYVQKEGNIGELISKDFGKTWEYGALTGQGYQIATPGGLAAYPGDRWRVIIRMENAANKLVELYEASKGSWSKYIIP